jgi:hypothetical protein
MEKSLEVSMLVVLYMVKVFHMDIMSICPSQLYISEKKLHEVQKSLNPKNMSVVAPIPIKELHRKTIFVDGHTRAVALYLLGEETIPVYWEYEVLDWEAYENCVQWCEDEGVLSIADLAKRIISHQQYELLWYKRCDDLHVRLELERKNANISL